MSTPLRTYLVLLLFAFLAGCLTSCEGPEREVDWSRNYRTHKKSPFGLYILAREIESMQPGFEKVEIIEQSIPQFLLSRSYDYKFAISSQRDHTFFYVDNHPRMYASTVQIILDDFVVYGNQAFVSMHDVPKEFYEFYSIELARFKNPSSKANFVLENSDHKFTLDIIDEFDYFDIDDDNFVVPLGYIETMGEEGKRYCNFLAFPYGEGVVFLHSSPEMFTNYSMLTANNSNYVADVLSHLHRSNIIWFSNYDKERDSLNENEYGLLSYIMSQPGLKAAWYMLWLILLFFVLTKIKRVQRIIPVFARKKNFSVDYAKRMAQFHLLEKNYHGLIETQILLILEKLRTDYRLDTTYIDDAFAEKMHKATNCNSHGAREFVRYLSKHKIRTTAFDFDFEELMKIINKLNLK